MKTGIAVLSIALLVSGCASNGAVTTITETANSVTTTFSGAAVQRDLAYMDRGKHRDSQDNAMYRLSGVNIINEMVTLADGTTAYLPKSITVRAPHTWSQKIETRPPDHRGWATLDKGLNVATMGILGYFLNDAFKGKTTGPVYGGDYNPQTAEPYIITPEIITP